MPEPKEAEVKKDVEMQAGGVPGAKRGREDAEGADNADAKKAKPEPETTVRRACVA
jgi:hypothetical protein